MTRNTTTGAVLEAKILPALDRGGHQWRVQEETGTRPGGRKHQVDAFATRDGRRILVNVVTLEAFIRIANNGKL